MTSVVLTSNRSEIGIAETEEDGDQDIGQLVEASIVQLVEGGDEEDDETPTITGATSLANRTMVLNEATGEVEVIDLADPTMSHEVEVVTVDSDRFFGPRRLGGQLRLKNAPALLRNSRRFNSSGGFHVQEVPQMQQVIMAPATLPPASAGFLKSMNRQSSSSGTPIVNTSHPHTSRLSQSSNFSNVNIMHPSMMTFKREPPPPQQQFVILSDGGIPMADTEYSIVQDEDLQEKLRELLMQQNDEAIIAPNIVELDDSAQTIYICGGNENSEETVEVAEVMEEIDGSFVDNGNGNIIYHLDEDGNLYSVSGMGTADSSGNAVLDSSLLSGLGISIGGATNKRRGRKSSSKDNSKLEKKRAQTELRCLESGCQSVCYNVGELRKHLAAVHENHFDEETVIFGSEDAFKSWRESYERERMVSFIYRGGTKKIAKDQAVTYLICHRSGHYKPTMGDISKRKRKMKPQGSCKMGGYCTAGIKLLKNLDTGEVKMDICHTHYGHALDNQAIPHLRVNPMLRNVILNKFKEGMTFNEVLEFIHHNPNGLEGLRLVDRRAVRNIFDQWKNPRRRSKTKQIEEPNVDSDDAEHMDDENPPGESILSDLLETNANDAEFDSAPVEADQESENSNAPSEEETPKLTCVSADNSSTDKCSKKEISEDISDGDKSTEEDDDDDENPENSAVDISNVKQEHVENDSDGLKCPTLSPSKANYNLRPKRQSLAHLLQSKRSRQNSQSAEAIAATQEADVEPEEKEPSPPPSTTPPVEKKRGRKKKIVVENVKDEANKLSTIVEPEVEIEKELPQPPEKKRGRKRKISVDIIKKEAMESIDETIEAVVVEQPDEDTIAKAEEFIEKLVSQKNKRRAVAQSEKDFSDDDHDPKFINNIEQCIEKLYKHGESGPTVLLYKKPGKIAPTYGDLTRGFRESDSCIVLQTPVQRQIMQMFPKIIGIELIEGKVTDMKLVFVMVIDDYREAIPVAWMVTDAIESRVITNFFRCLRNECGEIETTYLMAPKTSEFHRLWCMTFSSKPKYIQNEYDARKDLRMAVQQNFTNEDTKKAVWQFMETLLTERDVKVFLAQQERVKDFFENLDSPNAEIFLKSFQKTWMSAPKEWALAYRIDTPVNTIFAADSFAKLKKFISFKGTKRLKSSVDHILKIGYDKCFLRSKRMFKGDQKHSQHLEEIKRRHLLTQFWKPEYLSVVEENFSWHVQVPEESNPMLVTDVKSPCQCKTVCSECSICMHIYLCSCRDFVTLKIMCEHIHFVHSTRNKDKSFRQNACVSSDSEVNENESIIST